MPDDIEPVDLVVDLDSEDESGLPWTFLDEAHGPGARERGGLARRRRGVDSAPSHRSWRSMARWSVSGRCPGLWLGTGGSSLTAWPDHSESRSLLAAADGRFGRGGGVSRGPMDGGVS